MLLRSTPAAAVIVALLGDTAMAQASDSTPASDTTARRRWVALPGFGWSPETGFEAGFTVLSMVTWRGDSARRPTTVGAYAVRSARAQTRIAAEYDGWAPGNRRRVQASLAAVEYPFSFHGIGDRTTAAQEERYVPRWVEGYAQVDTRVRPGVFVLYGMRVGYQDVTPRSPGLLESQLIEGSRITRTVIATVGATLDTRDNIVSTRRGRLWSVAYGRSAPVLGASHSYGRLDASWRGFRTVGGEHVIGGHVSLVGVDGTIPFDKYAIVGGSRIMRGYGAGRFRDQWVAAMQAEYRTPIVLDRFGAVAFAGVGAAAPRPGAFVDSRAFPSVGVGVRLQADPVQRTALRVDYAVGAYGFSALYVGFNQAF